MLCLRCGSCCYSRAVVIKVGERAVLKPADTLCPYLECDGSERGELRCSVHHEPWFRETACAAFGEHDRELRLLEPQGRPCPTGAAAQLDSGVSTAVRAARRADLARLEELGPWECIRRRQSA